MPTIRDNGCRIVERISCLPLPEEGGSVESANDLLDAFVSGSDSRGYYFADPRLLRALFWWQETDSEKVRKWRDELVKVGDIEIKPIGLSCYTKHPVDIAVLVNPRRFERFAPRADIPYSVRKQIYERDGYRCIWCNATTPLSLDHIRPVSKGGSDDPENLQTLCQPCNSRKHNMDDDVAKRRVVGGCL